jgi:glutaredoxin
MEAQVLGLSVDSMDCLRAWAISLGGIEYPLLSDFYPHGEVAQRYGVLLPDGRSERAIFVIDKQGIVRYVDVHDIDAQPDNDVLFAELAKLEPDAAARWDAQEQARQAASPVERPREGGVLMYCTPWCPDCRQARAWLKEHNISFVEVDISKDRAAARQVKEWANGNEITPTFDIHGKIIVDWDLPRVRDALGVKK